MRLDTYAPDILLKSGGYATMNRQQMAISRQYLSGKVGRAFSFSAESDIHPPIPSHTRAGLSAYYPSPSRCQSRQ